MSKVQKGINADKLCYPISQFIWASANWYCIFSNFHFVLMYHTLYFPLCVFTLSFPCILWSFALESKRCLKSNDSSLFRKRFTIHHFNIQTATAENKEQDTLSNIVSIQFQNCDFFLWGLLWSRGSLNIDKLLEKYR